jgi:cGMP-dependent protein kinase 2
VKVFVRDQGGHPVLVRELGEGSFFGEIALLTGAPRSGTVTAGSRSELLELDRSTLDAIVATHPRVGEAIRETARERSGSDAETRARLGDGTKAQDVEPTRRQ